MTGYLSSILARHLGQSRSIQPRLPGRFEPPVAPALAIQTAPFRREPVLEGPERGDRIRWPSGLEDDRRRELERPVRADAGVIDPVTSPAVEGLGSSALPRADAVRPVASRKAPRPEGASRKDLPDEAEAAAGAVEDGGGRRPRRRPTERDELRSLPSAPLDAPHESVRPTTAFRAPTPEPNLAPDKSHDRAVAPGLIAPRRASMVPPATAPPAATRLVAVHSEVIRPGELRPTLPVTPGHSPSTPSPAIEVTIGRVEVRAMVAPEATAPGKRSGPPVMTLDEYLRRRAGGGAR
jgi:hypothetical protein